MLTKQNLGLHHIFKVSILFYFQFPYNCLKSGSINVQAVKIKLCAKKAIEHVFELDVRHLAAVGPSVCLFLSQDGLNLPVIQRPFYYIYELPGRKKLYEYQ